MDIPAQKLLSSLLSTINRQAPNAQTRCGRCSACATTSKRLLRSWKFRETRKHKRVQGLTGRKLSPGQYRGEDLVRWCRRVVGHQNSEVDDDDDEGEEDMAWKEPNEAQLGALKEWDRMIKRPPVGELPHRDFLVLCFGIFDEYLFDYALEGMCQVDFLEEDDGGEDVGNEDDDGDGAKGDGETSKKRRILGNARDYWNGSLLRVRIGIAHPRQRWTRSLLQQTADTMLHEMVHAFLMLYACRCGNCSCVLRRARTLGVVASAHGPLWREIVLLMGNEVRRTLPALVPEGAWDLDGQVGSPSHVAEIRAVVDSVAQGEIGRTELEELKEALFWE